MNPNNETERNRLFRAMEWSYRQLKPFRSLVAGLVEEYAGSGYGDPGSRPRYEILVNLMNQTVDAYTMSLVANRPRVLVTAPYEGLNYFAKHFQLALNNLIQEIQLEITLRQAVLNAFFCMGIVKVHMAESVEVELENGFWADPGTPFASSVSLDNWVHDMSATRWDQVRYAGDCYRIPFEDLKSDIFDQKAVKDLSPTSKHLLDDGDERLDQIAKGGDTDQDEYEPMVDVMDVWIPRESKVFTFPTNPRTRFMGTHGPIADLEVDDPEWGPYHALGFNEVPENILPAGPASHLAGLARMVNNLLRKQKRRAESQRDIFTYTPAGAEGAKKVLATQDQGSAEVQDPREMQVIKMGGIDSGTQAFTIGAIEMFDRMAGNLTAMMGLGSQAPTLGQEQMIQGAVSKKEAHMQYRTLDFARGICVHLGRLLWQDVAKVIPAKMPVEGAEGVTVDATWTPQDREGSFEDYQWEIDVYSMPYQSPQQRVQALNTLLTQIYVPLAPMLAQQGGRIDLAKLTDIFAELLNLPRLREVVQFSAPAVETGPDLKGGPPAATTRNYVRRNVPTGGTPQSRSQIQQQAWIDQAGQVNPDQMASMGQAA